MVEQWRIGYILLFIGAFIGLIEAGLTLGFYLSYDRYISLDSHLGFFIMVGGFVCVKFEQIIDNQKKIMEALNIKNEPVEKIEETSN